MISQRCRAIVGGLERFGPMFAGCVQRGRRESYQGSQICLNTVGERQLSQRRQCIGNQDIVMYGAIYVHTRRGDVMSRLIATDVLANGFAKTAGIIADSRVVGSWILASTLCVVRS